MTDGTDTTPVEDGAAAPADPAPDATPAEPAPQDAAPAEPAADPVPTPEETILGGDEDQIKGAPEEYAEFTVPDGMQIDDKLLEKAAPKLKELDLSQLQAQELVNIVAESRQADAQALDDSYNNTLKEWKTAAKSDPEYGGDRFQENIGKANAAIDKLGTPELKQMLHDTGIGNHPELIRFAVKVGAMIAEDSPGTDANAPLPDQDPADRWYPNQSSGA